MKRCFVLLLAVCILLSGCSSWLDGSYISTVPHQEQEGSAESQLQAVSSYAGLYRALKSMVRNVTESGLMSVANYNQLVIARDMRIAVQSIKTTDPIGVYAVEDITFELGTNAGKPAISVDIQYIHDRTEIQNIRTVNKMAVAENAIAEALDNCSSGLVLHIEHYEERDFVQWVDDYADQNPERVMEAPQVTANLYPQTGEERLLELKFTYQNSRDALRIMQTQVSERFTEMISQIRQQETIRDQYMVTYTYLMELFQEYQPETSITPAYMLLLHGVGDSSAFATVYSAVCRKHGLENIVVTGTRDGVPWSWNIICLDGVYYHVDLLRSIQEGSFREFVDADMSGYVWDYSAYPACGVLPEPTAEE